MHPIRDTAGRLERVDDLSVCLGLPEIAARLPETVKHLAIVPDDILAHVPFAALPVHGRPLIERFSVVLVPSLTWLERSPRQPLAPSDRTLGWRSLRRQLTTATQTSPAPWERSAPPGRPGRQNGPNSSTTTPPTTASEKRSIGPRSRILPVTATSFPSVRTTRASCSETAYHLKLGDLALAVLASCWGASATVLPGGVHIGLPFALLDAGARAAVASLWKVADRANQNLVGRFYSSLGNSGPIGALAEAQREAVQNRVPAAHWAGYVAFGGGIAPRWPWRVLLAHGRRAGPQRP
ncbi:MAG: CHAT domain-containing protein [bacterium]|nr:CHAT domain-containing protein [bacterium]